MCKSILKTEISLRSLKLEDAEPMLEWMTNPDIYKKMQFDGKNQTLEKCQKFIQHSWNDKKNLHYAITNSSEEYLGTVSLKNIDEENCNAEFAIVIMPSVMGKGIALVAMQKILEKAFYELGLSKVYLYVRNDNERAVKFYRKNQIRQEGCFRKHLFVDEEFKDVFWFAMLKDEYVGWLESVFNVSL